MEAGEYGLTRGTCFVERRLEVVAVAALIWISSCVWGGADFLCVCVFFFERTRPAASKRPPCLIYLSTSKTRLKLLGLVHAYGAVHNLLCYCVRPRMLHEAQSLYFCTCAEDL